jgi:hypothetical protein
VTPSHGPEVFTEDITISDRLPLSEIQQQFTNLLAQNVPEILTKTKYYEASWSVPKSGNWQLQLKSLASSEDRLSVLIRSVGPAGGAIPTLDWDGNRLLISDRWIVKDIPNPHAGSTLRGALMVMAQPTRTGVDKPQIGLAEPGIAWVIYLVGRSCWARKRYPAKQFFTMATIAWMV